MDFDKKVAAFTRKKKGQDMASAKREAYRAMLKEYQELKYAPTAGSGRREREVTQELIDKRVEEKKAVQVDTVANSLIDFVDLDIGAIGADGALDLEMGKPTPNNRGGKRK